MLSHEAESPVQTACRLYLAGLGWHMWRNNSGVLPNPGGRPVRFGLANDSKKLNTILKSGDLIGWTASGRFASVECKSTDGPTERAQIQWRNLVLASGGFACIVASEDDLRFEVELWRKNHQGEDP